MRRALWNEKAKLVSKALPDSVESLSQHAGPFCGMLALSRYGAMQRNELGKMKLTADPGELLDA